MAIASLLTRPMTLQQRRPTGAANVLGNRVMVETDVTLTGYLELLATSENLTDGQRSEATHRVFLPAGTSVEPTDRLVVDSDTFDVIGQADHVWNPRTRLEHHVEVQLRRTVGA